MDQVLSPYMMLAGAQLGATVAKIAGRKAVDALARSSLRGVSNALNHRFRGNSEVQNLKAELELKVKVLLLPVDACVKQALHGNTVLQGAVDVALEALRQIEAFEEAMQAQDLSSARGVRSGSSDALSAAQTCTKLRKLISQLDTLVPFLTLAIASSGLAGGCGMGSGQDLLSPARLLFASGALAAAAAAGCSPACVFEIQRALLYTEVSSRSQSGMKVLFPVCSVRVMTTGPADGATTCTPAVVNDDSKHTPGGRGTPASRTHGSDGSDGQANIVPRYALHVQQDFDDGLHHDDSEVPGAMTLLISDMTGVSWTTANSLGLDTDPFSPVLAVHVSPKSAADPTATAATPTLSGDGNVASAATQPLLYAIQCVAQAATDDESSDQDSVNQDVPPGVTDAGSSRAEAGDKASNTGGGADSTGYKPAAALSEEAAADGHTPAYDDPQSTLGRLEYVLRLCCLETHAGVPHTANVQDADLRQALLATAPVLPTGAGSPTAAGSMDRMGSLASAVSAVRSQASGGTPGADSVTRNLTKLGFSGAI